MYIEVTSSIFHNAFQSTRQNQFTYAGLNALFNYMEECESGDRNQYGDNGTELDVIAICCDFCQYDTIEECLQAYRLEGRDELEQNTIVIDCDDDTIIIQNF